MDKKQVIRYIREYEDGETSAYHSYLTESFSEDNKRIFGIVIYDVLVKHAELLYDKPETTIWSSISELTDKEVVNIGRQIRNTQIYIMDSNLQPVPKGSIGEICIGGFGLAKGYRNNELQTKEHFVMLPNGERI